MALPSDPPDGDDLTRRKPVESEQVVPVQAVGRVSLPLVYEHEIALQSRIGSASASPVGTFVWFRSYLVSDVLRASSLREALSLLIGGQHLTGNALPVVLVSYIAPASPAKILQGCRIGQPLRQRTPHLDV